MSSHLSKFHVCQIFFWVVASHAAVPTIPNGVYDQTTITPFTIGSCTGEGAGCSGVYGMSWLSDGRMVLLTSDYQQHGQMPYPGHPRSKVTLLSGLTGGGSVVATDIATHFKLPTGVEVVNDRIYVSDMDSVYMVPTNSPSNDSLSRMNNRRRMFETPTPTMFGGNTAPTNFAFPSSQSGGGSFTVLTSHNHHYVFTPVYYQGKFYANYAGATLNGNGSANLNPASFFSGALLSWDTTTTQLDTNANRAGGGLRSPNGNCLGPGGVIFSADNQGSYLPMCTITRFKPFTNQFAGYRQDQNYTPNFAQAAYDRGQWKYEPPVAVNYYDQTNHAGWVSLAQPFYLTSGPYAGNLLVGDMNSRGMWRVAFDTLQDTTNTQNIQGAVFFFTPGAATGGLGVGNNGINRITQGPDGTIYAGVLRGVGNWGMGPASNMIYKFTPKANPTQFEVLSIRSLQDGYELILNRKVNPATAIAANFTVGQRTWVRKSGYGLGAMSSNPAQYQGVTPVYYNRPISSVSVSTDSMRIHLVVPGIKRINQVESGVKGDSIVHWHTQFTISANLMSISGAANYTTEAAYAQNWISSRTWDPAIVTAVAPSRHLSLLENKVWFVSKPGNLRVNVDNMSSPYQAILRDPQGRVLLVREGTPGTSMEIAAPKASQSVYLIEIRSDGDSYRKIVTF